MKDWTTDESSLMFRKPSSAIVMVPRRNKISPLGRKLYNVMLYLAQQELKVHGSIPPANHLFKAPMSELLRVCGAEYQHVTAKKYLDEMRRTEVVWDSPDSGSELQHVGYQLLIEVRIMRERNRALWVHYALPPSTYEDLMDERRWAKVDLLILSRLHTYAAIVLYEICTKYRDNPSKVTCKRSPSWWTEVLSLYELPLDEHGARKVPEWRRFKSKFVKNAIDQVNELTDLNIELLEDKEGGKSAKWVQFKVEPKRHARKGEEGAKPAVASPELLKFASSLGIKNEKAVAKMANAHGDDDVGKALQTLERRNKQMNLELVQSPERYVKALLDKNKPSKNQNGESQDQQALLPAQVKSQQVSSVDAAAAAVKQDQGRGYAETRRELAFAELMIMPADKLNALYAKWVEHSMDAKWMTPAFQKRIADGEWKTGVLKNQFVTFYGEAKYGANWLEAPEEEVV